MKKKLLVLTSTFPRWKNDNLPPFVYELSKRLTSNFDVYVLAPHFKGSKKFEIMEDMKVYRFQYFPKNYENLVCSGGALPKLNKNKMTYIQVPFFFLVEFISLLQLIKKIKPDLIHAHWIPQGIISAIASKFLKVPFIITSLGADAFTYNSKLGIILKRFALNNSLKIIAVSTSIKNTLLNKINKKLKIDVIPMGVDCTTFNPTKINQSIKKKYNIRGPLLLFVGRLTEKKGVEFLIKSMPEILKKHPKAKLMIIGSGELEKKLKDLTIQLKLADRILFMGPLTNSKLAQYYATADIFIAPSIIAHSGDREGLPVTILEALSSGTKVVFSKFIDQDLAKDFSNVYTIREKNSDDLARIVNEALKRKKESSDLKLFNKMFDWNSIVKKYLKFMNV